MTNSKIQFRATCPICFKEHAVKQQGSSRTIEKMVDHGYTIPYEWHQRNGSCEGVGAPHFGTPEGLLVTKDHRAYVQEFLDGQKKALAGPAPKKIHGPKRNGYKAPQEELTEADGLWFMRAQEHRVYMLESSIRNAKMHLEFLDRKIGEWKKATPIQVEVEKKGPILHLQFKNGHFSHCSCGAREQNMRGGYTQRITTEDMSKVTCARCLQYHEQRQARAAKKVQA